VKKELGKKTHTQNLLKETIKGDGVVCLVACL